MGMKHVPDAKKLVVFALQQINQRPGTGAVSRQYVRALFHQIFNHYVFELVIAALLTVQNKLVGVIGKRRRYAIRIARTFNRRKDIIKSHLAHPPPRSADARRQI